MTILDEEEIPVYVTATVSDLALINTTCNSPNQGTTSEMLYRTKCDISTIPNIARNMTWSDPFYENCNNCYDNDITDVICVFDIDRTKYDHIPIKIYKYIFIAYITIVILGFCCTLLFAAEYIRYSIIIWGQFSLAIMAIILLLIVIFDCIRRSNKARLHRTHIAITQRGIEIDEEDGNENIFCRNLVPYKDIHTCIGKTEYCMNQCIQFRIIVTTKLPPTIHYIDGKNVVIEPIIQYGGRFDGIHRDQKQIFVDIVNLMKERYCIDTTTINDAANTIIITNETNTGNTILSSIDERINVNTSTTVLATVENDIVVAKLV